MLSARRRKPHHLPPHGGSGGLSRSQRNESDRDESGTSLPRGTWSPSSGRRTGRCQGQEASGQWGCRGPRPDASSRPARPGQHTGGCAEGKAPRASRPKRCHRRGASAGLRGPGLWVRTIGLSSPEAAHHTHSAAVPREMLRQAWHLPSVTVLSRCQRALTLAGDGAAGLKLTEASTAPPGTAQAENHLNDPNPGPLVPHEPHRGQAARQ